MSKIKILFEGLSNNVGGIETYIYNLYKNIDKEKFEINFLVEKGINIAFEKEYKMDNIKFFEVEDRKKNYFRYLKELKEIYINNKFDFIHIKHTPVLKHIMLILLILKNIPSCCPTLPCKP